MTRSMAIEFAPYGIRVNAVSPGLTDTQIWNDLQDAAEDAELARQHWMDNIPLGRVQTPREVGNVVLFLAGEQSSYVTGANIFTDGGMTAQLTINARTLHQQVIGGEGAARAEVSFQKKSSTVERCFLAQGLRVENKTRRCIHKRNALCFVRSYCSPFVKGNMMIKKLSLILVFALLFAAFGTATGAR